MKNKKKKGFTLIELLAIIVILAIIAVITVPIILNIIENSRKGATQDSAYGFKDAVNKAYVTKLSGDSDYNITDGTYTVSDLKTQIGLSVSGKEPGENSWVTITKNNVTEGCLQYDEFKVELSDGKVTNTEKGECKVTPKIDSCPGCTLFAYTTNSLTIGTSTAPDDATTDYTTLTEHPYFLGFITNSDTGVIERAFTCGIENDTPFCLEGFDPSKYSDDDNVGILNTIFPECGADASNSYARCYGSSVDADADDSGCVSVYDDNGYCYIDVYNYVYCGEE